MAWLRDGNLQPDTGFTVGDVNYPAGWIKNNSQSERDKLNITLAPQEQYHDQRFSWGWKADGTEIWKDLAELKKTWTEIQEEIANQTLSESDWRIVKAQETSGTVASSWTTYRAAVRTACNNRQAEFNAASTAQALKALVTSSPTVTQIKKDDSGNAIEKKDGAGNSYDPKEYEHETIPNNGNIGVKYPWPDAPTS